MLFHYNTLKFFQEAVYENILTKADLVEEIEIRDEGQFWLIEKDRRKYLLPLEVSGKDGKLVSSIERLPIRVLKTRRISFRNKILNRITRFKSLKIKEETIYDDFSELVDVFCQFKHSNPDEFLLWKLIVLTGWFTRINVRVSAPSEFGKTSVVDCLGHLTQDTCVITAPRRITVIEYRLFNKLIAIDELANLTSSEQKSQIQEFLLHVGDLKNKYIKTTRGTRQFNTYDEYDISNLSLIIMMNPYSYYEEVGQERYYFDRVFTQAVKIRFFPVMFEGELDINQFRIYNQPTEEDVEILKGFLHSLAYYRKQYNEMDYEPEEDIPETIKGKQVITLDRILKTIRMYGKQEDRLKKLLFTCHERYLKQFVQVYDIGGGQLTLPIHEEVVR